MPINENALAAIVPTIIEMMRSDKSTGMNRREWLLASLIEAATGRRTATLTDDRYFNHLLKVVTSVPVIDCYVAALVGLCAIEGCLGAIPADVREKLAEYLLAHKLPLSSGLVMLPARKLLEAGGLPPQILKDLESIAGFEESSPDAPAPARPSAELEIPELPIGAPHFDFSGFKASHDHVTRGRQAIIAGYQGRTPGPAYSAPVHPGHRSMAVMDEADIAALNALRQGGDHAGDA